MTNHPISVVSDFMELGGQHFPLSTDHGILPKDIEPFLARIEEELIETVEATYDKQDRPNIAAALDGAIDTAYVALTLAIRLVGRHKAGEAWDAVVDANLAKVDGRHGEPIIHPRTGKIGKPEGWTAPDIEAIVR